MCDGRGARPTPQRVHSYRQHAIGHRGQNRKGDAAGRAVVVLVLAVARIGVRCFAGRIWKPSVDGQCWRRRIGYFTKMRSMMIAIMGCGVVMRGMIAAVRVMVTGMVVIGVMLGQMLRKMRVPGSMQTRPRPSATDTGQHKSQQQKPSQRTAARRSHELPKHTATYDAVRCPVQGKSVAFANSRSRIADRAADRVPNSAQSRKRTNGEGSAARNALGGPAASSRRSRLLSISMSPRFDTAAWRTVCAGASSGRKTSPCTWKPALAALRRRDGCLQPTPVSVSASRTDWDISAVDLRFKRIFDTRASKQPAAWSDMGRRLSAGRIGAPTSG